MLPVSARDWEAFTGRVIRSGAAAWEIDASASASDTSL
jgi:hypothetical protein